MTRPLAIPASLELLARAARDGPALGTGGAAITRLTSLGDSHLGGRRVVRVEFGPRLTTIYKPRPIGPEIIWNRCLRWLGRRASAGPFLTPATLARARYAWVEALTPRRPATRAEGRMLARRAGTLLALLDVLEVRDAHRENVLIVGDQPVLVDAETSAHPRFATFRRTPSMVLTGFLPAPGSTDRRAGIGLAAAFPDEVIEGYCDGFGILRVNGAELMEARGPLRGLATMPLRVVLRPTALYAEALRQSKSAWPPAGLSPLPIPRSARGAVEVAERAALDAGDVPIFHCLGGGVDLMAGGSVVASQVFRISGMAAIARRVASLTVAEERRSVELLRAVLAQDAWRKAHGKATRGK